jgi:hypothetical protein
MKVPVDGVDDQRDADFIVTIHFSDDQWDADLIDITYTFLTTNGMPILLT